MDIVVNLKYFLFNWKASINKYWAKFGVIVTVVLTSVILSYWGTTRILILLLVLLVGIAMTLTIMKYPNLGFIFIILGGMFIPFVGPSGLNVAVGIVALLLILWFLDMLVVKRSFRFVKSRVMLPILAFLVISVLAFGIGQIPWFAFARQAPLTAQAGGFAIFVLSLGALLLAAHLIQDVVWLQFIVWSFIGTVGIYVSTGFLNIPVGHFFHSGALGSMFWMWFVTLTCSQIVFNSELKLRIRVLLLIVLMLAFYQTMVQGYEWKSGWLPSLMSVCVILGIRFKRLVPLVIPLGVFLLIYSVAGLITSDAYSWGTRVDAWKIVLEISRVSPLLGLGFSNYYWYTPLFPIRGYAVSFNTHSQYVDLIAQTGYLGLLCFIWLFFAVGRLSWNLSRNTPNGFSRAYLYGVFAGIVGSLVSGFLGDWVLPFVYNLGLTGFRSSILPWIFFGGVISIEQMVRQKTGGER